MITYDEWRLSNWKNGDSYIDILAKHLELYRQNISLGHPDIFKLNILVTCLVAALEISESLAVTRVKTRATIYSASVVILLSSFLLEEDVDFDNIKDIVTANHCDNPFDSRDLIKLINMLMKDKEIWKIMKEVSTRTTERMLNYLDLTEYLPISNNRRLVNALNACDKEFQAIIDTL